MMTLKMATESDAISLGQLHYNCWHQAFTGIIDDSYLEQMNVDDNIKVFESTKCRNVVESFVHNKMIGFCRFGECCDTDILKNTAEIYAVYVDQLHQKKGYGRKMIQQAIRELREDDYRQLVAWIIKDDIESLSFFEAVGFVYDGSSKEMDFNGPVKFVRYFRNI